MSKLHITSMDSFNDLSNLLGLDMQGQLDALNSAYKNKVRFEYDDFEHTIVIAWSDESVNGLELPNCDYIDYKKLFRYSYDGNITFLRLPKNERNKVIRLDKIDSKCNKLNALVLQNGTELIIDSDSMHTWGRPKMVIIEKPSGNNRVLRFNN